MCLDWFTIIDMDVCASWNIFVSMADYYYNPAKLGPKASSMIHQSPSKYIYWQYKCIELFRTHENNLQVKGRQRNNNDRGRELQKPVSISKFRVLSYVHTYLFNYWGTGNLRNIYKSESWLMESSFCGFPKNYDRIESSIEVSSIRPLV
jgi:hypothetical protein